MRRTTKFIGLFAGVALIAVGAVNSSAIMKRAEWFYELCGVERWSVKTGTDADASKINLSAATATTIAAMTAFPAQASPPANNRIAPYETTLWTLDATLVEFKAETDDDYHLVLKDASGNTMIAEIPLPSCVGNGSPFLNGITNARSQFDAKYSPSSSFQTVNIPVRVQGVGMFDFAHGQTGAAPNQIELHPVINIIFNPGSGGSPPPAPTSLSAVAGTGKVSLAWNASAGAATYNLYRSNASGAETSYQTGLTALSYADSGLTAGTTYYYKVTAANANGESAKSNEASATPTSGASAPAVPTNLSATAGAAQVGLTWTSSAGAASYNIYRATTSGAETSYKTGLTAAGFTDTTVTNGTTYYYQVTAVNSVGESAKSSQVSATPTGGAGSGTQLLGNTGFENGTAAAPWVAGSGVIDNGTSETPHSGAWEAWLCGYGTTHSDTLYQQTTIAAGSMSATLTFWLHIDTAETTATAQNDTLQIQVRDSSGTVLATLGTYSNLNVNTGYAQQTFNLSAYIGQTIQVCLVGSENSSLQTSFVVDDFALNVVSGSGGTVPAVPAGLAATAGAAQIALAWSASAGAVSYNVYRSNSAGTETLYKTGLTAPALTDAGLTNGTTYYYKVTAVNAVGESAKSNEANATPAGGAAQQLLGNPGFESGASVWTAASGVISNATGEPARTGSYKAWLCGYGSAHTDTLYQTVTIPSNITTATLTFWLHIDTADTSTTTAHDTLNVQIRNSSGAVLTTLATYSNLNANTGYAQKSFNLAAYKGQTIQVYLLGVEDASKQTSFVVDDFALNAQ